MELKVVFITDCFNIVLRSCGIVFEQSLKNDFLNTLKSIEHAPDIIYLTHNKNVHTLLNYAKVTH